MFLSPQKKYVNYKKKNKQYTELRTSHHLLIALMPKTVFENSQLEFSLALNRTPGHSFRICHGFHMINI